jgi:DNA-binding transcriptional LysR family regulator
MPRRVVTRAFGWAVSRRLGRPVSDPTSGFRAFDATAIDTLAPIFPRPYLSDTVELLLIASEHGLGVTAVPVRMVQRSSGSASVGPIKGVGFAVRMILIIVRHSRFGAWMP